MPHANSTHSFTSEYDVLDRALNSPRGIRLAVDTHQAASTFRGRLHHARVLDRRESRSIYPEGDPNYDKSQYDPLVVRIRTEDGRVWIYIEAQAMPTEIEEL